MCHSKTKTHASESSPGGIWAKSLGPASPSLFKSHMNVMMVDAEMTGEEDSGLAFELKEAEAWQVEPPVKTSWTSGS